MVESYKSKRVKFKKSGDQRRFILNAKNKLNLRDEQFSQKLSICSRTLKDWEKEKFNMALSAVRFICKRINAKFPKGIEIMDAYWYVVKGARKGGAATFKKYGVVGGNQEIRKEKWRDWWDREGKFKNLLISKPLPFKKPKLSKDLAEFIGIMLGDGGITKYQAKITLHCIDDYEYSKFVVNLITKLFGVNPSKHRRLDCQVFNVEISRIGLVRFCVEKLGLKIGNKVSQQVGVPKWILKNKKLRIACLRGLVDTDGCIIIHKYKSKGKIYTYKKLSFTNMSKPLLKFVSEILFELGIKNRYTNHSDIRIDAKKDIKTYFKLVGTHNPKHLKRYGINV